MENKIVLDLSLHYYLYEEGRHTMDAFVYNKCEAQILAAIQHLSKYVDTTLTVDVSVRQEGGVIDCLKVIFNKDSIAGGVVALLLNHTINLFFNKEQNTLASTEKRIEIIEKIKNSAVSEEEAELLVQSDATLSKCVSAYYKHLQTEPMVKSVSSQLTSSDVDMEPVLSTLERTEFDKKIVKTEKLEEINHVLSTTVNVISPILIPMQHPKWRCSYNGEEIVVEINDDAFLDQVYNKEVKFETGTSLTCDLDIKITTYPNQIDKKPTKKYNIVLVRKWSDGEHYSTETKRYVSLKNK